MGELEFARQHIGYSEDAIRTFIGELGRLDPAKEAGQIKTYAVALIGECENLEACRNRVATLLEGR